MTVVATCALGVAPAGAAAQTIFFGDDVRVVREYSLPVALTGGVAVTYAGDEAAGCAAAGLCGISGTTTWEPGSDAQLFVSEYVRQGRREAFAFLPFEHEGDGPRITASVSRAPAGEAGGTCADVREDSLAAIVAETSGPSLPLGLTARGPTLGGVDLLRTRCGGPLHEDVAGLLPIQEVPLRALRRGRLDVDLRGEAPFSAGGFAGTVRSDVLLRLGRARRQRTGADDQEHLDGLRRERMRAVSVTYSLERISGDVTAEIAGMPDPARCAPLDSCAARGTVTVQPAVRRGELVMSAVAPARFSRRRLLASLGILRGRAVRGSHAGGSAYWEGPGTATTVLARGAGGPTCASTAPLTHGFLLFDVAGGRLNFEYGSTPDPFDPLRTRCPGPLGEDAAGRRGLATGSVPLRALRLRTVPLRLDRGTSFSRRGWETATRADLTVVIRRGRITEDVFTTLAPPPRRGASTELWATLGPAALGLDLGRER